MGANFLRGPFPWPRPTLAERVLLSLSRTATELLDHGATNTYDENNALDYAVHTVPNFLERIRAKDVLDYGSGEGWQAVAMAMRGAKSVYAYDIGTHWTEKTRLLIDRFGLSDRVTCSNALPPDKVDVVVSLGAFEHYSDPAAELQTMRRLLRPNGVAIISFAEPWYSNNGSHLSGQYRIPWLNLLFSEKTVMKVRAVDHVDRATRYEDIRGGLNKMSVAKFERLTDSSGMKVVNRRLHSTRNLPLVTRIPVLRELLTSSCCCILQR